MHMRRRGRAAAEPPGEVRELVQRLAQLPLAELGGALAGFEWGFGKADLLHWAELLDRFDDLFAAYIAANPALTLHSAQPPSPQQPCSVDDLLRVLHVSQTLLSNSGSRQAYSSVEHLTHLLADPDWRVAKATLELLGIATRKSFTSSRHLKLNDRELVARLECIAHGAQGDLELLRNSEEQESHMEQMYRVRAVEALRHADSSNATEGGESPEAMPAFELRLEPAQPNECPLLKTIELCNQKSVPQASRFAVLWKLRAITLAQSSAAHSLHIAATSQLLALSTLLQCAPQSNMLARFFSANPDAVRSLLALSVEQSASLEKRALAASFLAAMSCDRSCYLQKLLMVLNGSSQRSYLGKLCKRTIELLQGSVVGKEERHFVSVVFLLIGALVASHSGASLLDEVGLPALVVPLLRETGHENAPLVSSLLRALDTFVERSRALSDPEAQMSSLKEAYIGRLEQETSAAAATASNQDELYNRRMIVKGILRAETILLYQAAGTTVERDSALLRLPGCLRTILENEERFGGSVFSHASNICCALLNQHPTCFSKLQAAGVPEAFLDSLERGIPPAADAILSIPSTLSAICLDPQGKAVVVDRRSMRALEEVFVSDEYRRAMQSGETSSMLGTAMDELMRHVPEQRQEGVDMLVSAIRRVKESDEEGFDARADALAHVMEAMAANSDTAQRFVDAGGLSEFMGFFTSPKLCVCIRERNRGDDRMAQTLATAMRGFVVSHVSPTTEFIRSAMLSNLNELNALDLTQRSLWSMSESDLRTATPTIVGVESLMVLLTNTFRSSATAITTLEADDEGDQIFEKIQEAATAALAQRAFKPREEGNGDHDTERSADSVSTSVLHDTGSHTSERNDSYERAEESTAAKASGSPASALAKSLDAMLDAVRTINTSIIKAASMHLRRRVPGEDRMPGESSAPGKSLDLCRRQGLAYTARMRMFAGDVQKAGHERALFLKYVLDDLYNALFDQRRSFSQPLLINSIARAGGVDDLIALFSSLLDVLKHSTSTHVPESYESAAVALATILQALCNSQMVLGGPNASVHMSIRLQEEASERETSRGVLPEQSFHFLGNLHLKVWDVVSGFWRHSGALQCSAELCERTLNILACIVAGARAGQRSDRIGSEPSDVETTTRLYPEPDANLVDTLVEMGFHRRGSERALQAVDNESVELAMDYLFSHPHLQDDHGEEHSAASYGDAPSQQKQQHEGAGRGKDDQAQARNAMPSTDELVPGILQLATSRTEHEILLSAKDLLKCLMRKADISGKEHACALIAQRLVQETGGSERGLYVASHLLMVAIKEESHMCKVVTRHDVLESTSRLVSMHSEHELLFKDWLPLVLLTWREVLHFHEASCEGSNSEQQHARLLGDGFASKQHSQNERKDAAMQMCARLLSGVACSEASSNTKPVDVLEAVLHLLAHLTAQHSLTEQFVDKQGIEQLLGLPLHLFNIELRRLHSLEKLIANVVRHALEDDVVLSQTMEAEIRAALQRSSRWQAGQSLQAFLNTTQPIAARSPEIFLQTVSRLCKQTPERKIVLRDDMSKPRDREAHRPSSTFTAVIDTLISKAFSDLSPQDVQHVGRDHEQMDVDIKSNGQLWAVRKAVQLRVLTDACAMYPTAAALVVKHEQRFKAVNTLLSSFGLGCTDKSNESAESFRNASKGLVLALSLRSPEGRRRVVYEVSQRIPKVFGSFKQAPKGGSQLASLLNALLSSGMAARAQESASKSGTDILRCMHSSKMPSSLVKAIEAIDVEDPRTVSLLSLLLRAFEILARDFVQTRSAQHGRAGDATDSERKDTSMTTEGMEHDLSADAGTGQRDGSHEEANANDNHLWVEPESYYASLVDEVEEDGDGRRDERHGQSQRVSEAMMDMSESGDEDMQEDDGESGESDEEEDEEDDEDDGHGTQGHDEDGDAAGAHGDQAMESDSEGDEADGEGHEADVNEHIAARHYLARQSSLDDEDHDEGAEEEPVAHFQYVTVNDDGMPEGQAVIPNNVRDIEGTDVHGTAEEGDEAVLTADNDEDHAHQAVVGLEDEGAEIADNEHDMVGLPSPFTNDNGGFAGDVVRIRAAPAGERRQHLMRGSSSRQGNSLILGSPPSALEHPAIANSCMTAGSALEETNHLTSSADRLRAVLTGLGSSRHDEVVPNTRGRRSFGLLSSSSGVPTRMSERENETRASVWESDALSHLGIPSMQMLESMLSRELANRLESHDRPDDGNDDSPASVGTTNEGAVLREAMNEQDNNERCDASHEAEGRHDEGEEGTTEVPPQPHGDDLQDTIASGSDDTNGRRERAHMEVEENAQTTRQRSQAEPMNEDGAGGDEDGRDEGAEQGDRENQGNEQEQEQRQIDPAFLAALPPELRAEVMATYGQHDRSAGGATGSAGGITALTGQEEVDPDFLAALPPDIQAEVLQQQAVARRDPIGFSRQAMDFARTGGNAGGHEEEAAGHSTATPTPAHATGFRSPPRSPSPMPDDEEDEEEGEIAEIAGLNRRRRQAPTRENARRRGQAAEVMKVDLRGQPMLESREIGALIRVSKQVYRDHKNALQNIFVSLCQHTEQRPIVLTGLLHPLVRQSTGSDGSPGAGSDRALQTSNLLEALSAVVKEHARSREALFEVNVPSPSAEAARKGKMKIGEANAHQRPLFSALVDLLASPSHTGLSSADLETVLNILYTCLNSIGESGDKDGAAHGEGGPNEAGAHQWPEERDEDESDSQRHQEKGASEEHAQSHALEVIRQLTFEELERLVSLLGEPDQTDMLYRRARDVIGLLSNTVHEQRSRLLAGFSNACERLLPRATNELEATCDPSSEERWSGCQAGKAILRLCRSASEVFNGAEDEELSAAMKRLSEKLKPLWSKLGECLSALQPQSRHEFLPTGATAVIPLIEAYFELCCRDRPERSVGCESAQDVWRFAERHRATINAFVRRNPGLLNASLKPLLKAPRLVDFDNKRKHFRGSIKKRKESYRSHILRVYVRRNNVLDDSYQQLHRKSSDEIKSRLNVNFQGEEGVDAGGPTREWFSILAREIFNPQYALFSPCDTGGRTFQPNPNSSVNPEHLPYFRFVGRLVGKALWDDVQMEAYFTRSFYKHMLRIPVSYDDIEALDPDFYKNLRWVIENDITNVLDLTFSTESHFFDVEETVDLKPNGRNIQVTEANKKEYVDLLCQYKMTHAIQDQINAFVHGFEEIIPHELASLFGPGELELLISGLPEIDIDDLAANTEYVGYSPSSLVIQWFWAIARSLNQEDRARLLQFCTGTSRVPLEGFNALQGISGPQRFQIHRASHEQQRLISAHTCFNQLDLPEYESKEALREKLMLAVYEASEGFGFQ